MIAHQWQSTDSDYTTSDNNSRVVGSEASSVAGTQYSDFQRNLYLAALYLRQAIAKIRGIKDKWPPVASDFQSDCIEASVPVELFNFLAWVVNASEELELHRLVEITDDLKRKIFSIGQDIVYLASRGRTTMPKHLAVGMTIRHVTGSSTIINLLNGLGHSASHSTALEHDTALATVQLNRKKLVPPGFEQCVQATVCWDNNDFQEETESGHGTTHNTNGIVVQRKTNASLQQTLEPERIAKTKKSSFISPSADIIPCKMNKKVGPTLVDGRFMLAKVNQRSHSCDWTLHIV